MSKVKAHLYNWIWKRRLNHCGIDVEIDKDALVDFSTCHFEGKNRIATDVKLNECQIGLGSYVSRETELKKTKIGRFCSIGPHVSVIEGQHPSHGFVSTHPAFFSIGCQAGFTFVDNNCFEEHRYSEEDYYVTIGNDVWIGDSAKIMEGVTIADGTIVAAGAIVVHDTEPFSIVGGVPAKCIGYRFDDNTINMIKQTAWWNVPFEQIGKNARYFVDNNVFIEKYNISGQSEQEVRDGCI